MKTVIEAVLRYYSLERSLLFQCTRQYENNALTEIFSLRLLGSKYTAQKQGVGLLWPGTSRTNLHVLGRIRLFSRYVSQVHNGMRERVIVDIIYIATENVN